MKIEILKNSCEELIVRINTFTIDKIIWTSKNDFGDWIRIVYNRKKSRVHRWGY